MIKYIILITLFNLINSCSSVTTPHSKKPTPSESSSAQSAKDEEYKRKIASLEKKIQELEKKKSEPVEVEPPKELSAPQEVAAPKEISAPKEIYSKSSEDRKKKQIKNSWIDPLTGMKFLFIPGGTFLMGSHLSEKNRFINETLHEVKVGEFWMGEKEVTNYQYFLFDPNHSSKDSKYQDLANDDQPVAGVTLFEAQAYAKWLSNKTGKHFHIPTEAMWEYAARAGTTSPYFWGENIELACNYANIADETSMREIGFKNIIKCDDRYKTSAPVGSYFPNAYGLYDMIGNVWEWTCSAYTISFAGNSKIYYNGNENNCSNKKSTRFVLRGGSWDNAKWGLRSAYRFAGWPGYKTFYNAGFRLVFK